MKLEDQVCSLELSKKLKELGVKQESLYYHDPSGSKIITQLQKKWTVSMFNEVVWKDIVSAYTVAELGEILVNYGQNFFPYFCDQENQKCFVHHWSSAYPDYVLADKEADARAKMLIYLIGNKLLTPKTHE